MLSNCVLSRNEKNKKIRSFVDLSLSTWKVHERFFYFPVINSDKFLIFWVIFSSFSSGKVHYSTNFGHHPDISQNIFFARLCKSQISKYCNRDRDSNESLNPFLQLCNILCVDLFTIWLYVVRSLPVSGFKLHLWASRWSSATSSSNSSRTKLSWEE